MTATARDRELFIRGKGFNYRQVREALNDDREKSTMSEHHNEQESTALATRRGPAGDGALATCQPMTPDAVVHQVGLIQDVMRRVMKEGEHYGRIPGCGDKPALLKSGAEKLATVFRIAPKYDIETIDLGGGHREYRVRVTLVRTTTGEPVGEGWGSCSTMESKYRWRWSDAEVVSYDIPGRYWQLKSQGKWREAREFLPAGCKVAKQHDGKWAIVKAERIENPDLADTWNTILKMACKRAFVGALLTCTAASDIFSMADFADDEPDDEPINEHASGDDDAPQQQSPTQPAAPAQGHPAGQVIHELNRGGPKVKVLGERGADRLVTRLRAAGRSFDDLLAEVRKRDERIYESMTGLEIEEIPASALPTIAAVLDSFTQVQTAAAEPAAADDEPTQGQADQDDAGGGEGEPEPAPRVMSKNKHPHIPEDDIPF